MTVAAKAGNEGGRSGTNIWSVPVLTLATFVTMLNAMALGPFLPVMAEDLNSTVSLLGQIPALSMLLAAALGLIVGPLADQFGHRKALMVSLAVAAVSSFAMGLSHIYLALMIAALVGAGGRAIAQPIAVVIASIHYTGSQQRRAIGWVSAGPAGAVVVGIPVMTAIAEFAGWRAAFGGLAGLTVVVLILAYVTIARDAQPKVAEGPPSIGNILAAYRPLVRHRPTLGLITSTLLGGASIWSAATYIGAFYDDRFNYSTQQIGWVYVVPGVALVAGSIAAGGRLGTVPLRPLVIGMRVLTGLAFGLLLIAPVSPLGGIVLLGIQGLSTGVATVAVALLLTTESPAGRATTMTLNVVALSLGTALGSALGGFVIAVSGFAALGLCSFAFSALSALLIWTYR